MYRSQIKTQQWMLLDICFNISMHILLLRNEWPQTFFLCLNPHGPWSDRTHLYTSTFPLKLSGYSHCLEWDVGPSVLNHHWHYTTDLASVEKDSSIYLCHGSLRVVPLVQKSSAVTRVTGSFTSWCSPSAFLVNDGLKATLFSVWETSYVACRYAGLLRLQHWASPNPM